MKFKVSFAAKAQADFDAIINYIETEFGPNSSSVFKKQIFDFATLMETFPEIGSIEVKEKNIRGFVVHRRLKAFYRIKGDKVIILRLFDTRQNPPAKF